MSVRRKTRNGDATLRNGGTLPDATVAGARTGNQDHAKAAGKSPRRRKLLRHAGSATDLPADAARNLDHYLYGHAKR